MAYSQEEIKEAKEFIIEKICEGDSLKSILDNNRDMLPTRPIIYEWLNESSHKYDAEFLNNYTRATSTRADHLFDEILEIADNRGGDVVIKDDGNETIDQAVIQRDRLRVDARKWALSKMIPKKYGDKIDINSENTNINIELTPEERAAKIAALKAKL